MDVYKFLEAQHSTADSYYTSLHISKAQKHLERKKEPATGKFAQRTFETRLHSKDFPKHRGPKAITPSLHLPVLRVTTHMHQQVNIAVRAIPTLVPPHSFNQNRPIRAIKRF